MVETLIALKDKETGDSSMYARYSEKTKSYQRLDDHLKNVANKAMAYAKNFEFEDLAFMAGLLHDLGKCRPKWQDYFKKSLEKVKQNKMDHATAGAQFLEKIFIENNVLEVAQIIQASIMFHHGAGLPDNINLEGDSDFITRLNKDIKKTGFDSVKENISKEINEIINEKIISFQNKNLKEIVYKSFGENCKPRNKPKSEETNKQILFNQGLHLRNFSSCLIDADRTDSIEFEEGVSIEKKVFTDWAKLKLKLEKHLNKFSNEDVLGKIRTELSNECATLGKKEKGTYTCSALTGSGKTFASLRFALEQAEKHKMEHIFIIAPYTSILDQNAEEIRKVLEDENTKGQIVLECHSNLSTEKKDELYEATNYMFDIETWNAPIIITTMVQFLQSLFGAGTQNIRRMRNISNSVLIFDEIQTLPVKSTNLFRWALEYLVDVAKCSALLCTATQPSLHKIGKDIFHLNIDDEIVKNIDEQLEVLKRVEFIDKTNCGKGKVSVDVVVDYINKKIKDVKSFLAVVNTKAQAKELYEKLKEENKDTTVYHLSTNLCPAHRKYIIGKIKNDLKDNKKIICVSTRLIEAGVDLSFESCLRYMAGLDSIIQTAGRCNRNNELKDKNGKQILGTCAIFYLQDENISSLKELKLGQESMERVLRDNEKEIKDNKINLLKPCLIESYFQYYYGKIDRDTRALDYYLKDKDTTIIDLLSDNKIAFAEYERKNNTSWEYPFRQAFKTAWENFEVIADITVGVLVPYKKGKEIIRKLYALDSMDKKYFEKLKNLLNESQQYVVNVYINQISSLESQGMISELKQDTGIYILNEGNYDSRLGMAKGVGGFSLNCF